MNVHDLLADPAREFVHLPGPSPQDRLESLRSRAPITLPDLYLRLLAVSNGPEGELGVEPGWFQLWRAEDVLKLNADYEVAEYHPGFFGIGSSGGGIMFALAESDSGDSPVFGLPFDSIDPADVRIISPDFESFFLSLGRVFAR